jgi:plasmid rolling circle replication initiator protein Rep
METLPLVDSYERLGHDKKSGRVKDCGSWLQFKAFDKEDLRPKLHNANFCFDLLCPMCAWRRAMKMFAQVAKVMNHAEGYKFIFLTLTCKNVYADNLMATVELLVRTAWQGLTRSARFKKSIAGFFRALEITHDVEKYITKKGYLRKKAYFDRLGLFVGDLNPSYNTYHPHIHVILAVEPKYYEKDLGFYIDQKEWRMMWQKAMKVDYDPRVDVRAVYDKKVGKANRSDISNVSAVAEVAKYSTKSKDYLIRDYYGEVNESLTDEAVNALVGCLCSRRLIAYGGVLKKIKEQLGLDDAIEGDLVLTTGETENDELNYILVDYNWNIGLKTYEVTRTEYKANIDIRCD